MHQISTCIACLLFQTMPTFGGTITEGTTKMIDINTAWTGMLPVEAIALLPEPQRRSRIGFIDNDATWSKIWKAHQADKKKPQVDFESQIVVFIRNVRYLNRITLVSAKLENGLLELKSKETRSARPVRNQVHCVLLVVDRTGIKQIGDGQNKIEIESP